MGAWGTGPLQNDAALDFVEAVRRTGKARRLDTVVAAIEAYREFHARMLAGQNVTVFTESDIADLWRSREQTLEWYRSTGQKLPLDLLPEMATEASYAAWIQEQMSAPQVDDGNQQASCLLAASHLLLEALDAGKGPLAHCTAEALRPAATGCAQAIGLLMDNAGFAEAWSVAHYAALSRHARDMASRLAAAG